MTTPQQPSQHKAPRCSFCGKSHTLAKKLIAGPSVYICDDCVRISCEILTKEMPDWPVRPRTAKDPLKTSYDLLCSMRDKGEISEEIFQSRILIMLDKEFSPEKKSIRKIRKK